MQATTVEVEANKASRDWLDQKLMEAGPVIRYNDQGMYILDDNHPRGAWELTWPAVREMMNRFDPEAKSGAKS